MRRIIIILVMVLTVGVMRLYGQDVAIKTNVVSDALLNINLGAEVALAPQWSLELTGDFNAWTLSDGKRWKHWTAMPEVRYWLCDHYDGHFFGLHAFGGQYNAGGISGLPDFLGTHFSLLENNRFQGWYVGAGLAYGYSWLLSRHWNIEAEIGVGWSYTLYDQYPCAKCGTKIATDKPHHYVGPTKAALNIVYVF